MLKSKSQKYICFRYKDVILPHIRDQGTSHSLGRDQGTSLSLAVQDLRSRSQLSDQSQVKYFTPNKRDSTLEAE